MALRTGFKPAMPAGGAIPGQGRRYLALSLPDWATDCLKRHDRTLGTFPDVDGGSPVQNRDQPAKPAPGRPLMLYERRDNALRLVAVDRMARAAGLGEGQSLSDARAICPMAVAREADPGFLAAMFARLADWHVHVSPIVMVMAEERPYGDLMLDITGVAPLFGGEAALLDMVVERLVRAGYRAEAAIAPSVGAAWALSHFSPGVIAREDAPSSGAEPVLGRNATRGHHLLPRGEKETGACLGSPSPLMGEGARRAGEGEPRHLRIVPLPAPPLGHPRDQGSGRVFDAIAAAQDGAKTPVGATPGREVAALLAPLPVAALRLDAETVAGLRQLGLKRIGQLYGRERGALVARFGARLVTRLDQALGVLDEKLVPRLPVPERYVDRKFAEPIGLIDDVMMTVTDLAHRLAGQLQAEGTGAQTFHLLLFRIDHEVMHLVVNAARATRDAPHVARLFANRIERLSGAFDAGFGIEMIRLMASSVFDLDEPASDDFLGGGEAAALDRLYDRMASRLGAGSVLRLKPLDSHIPERAVTLEPMVARTEDMAEAAVPLAAPRPLRLLPAPEPVKVIAEVPDGPPARMVWRRIGYRFLKASGPERIGAEWWRPGEGALSRDYYACEDDEGRRFWLFREGLYEDEGVTPRWFLHGLFG